MAKNLLDLLKDKGIGIVNCRGQSYDNASNMSGKYNGIQAFHDENVDDTELSPGENFKVHSFDVIINKLTCAIKFRIKAYSKVSNLFGFLLRLENINEQELRRAAEMLVWTYQFDLEISLANELVQFAFLMRTPLATKLGDNNDTVCQVIICTSLILQFEV